MFAAIFGFIAVLIGAIVLFTVTNTMSMAVVERTAEIGTLRAIGLQAQRHPRDVRQRRHRARLLRRGAGHRGGARAGMGDQSARPDLDAAGPHRARARWRCAWRARTA